MSLGTDCLAEAFSDTMTTHGEPLSLRGQSVLGIVNHSLKSNQVPNQPNFSLHNASAIDVAVSLNPSSGDVFVDKKGFRHRVQFVQFLGNCYRCFCEVSKV